MAVQRVLARLFLASLFSLLSFPLHAQRLFRPDTAALQRVLVAEDTRGTGADGIAPLVDGIRSRDTLLRRVAVRGMGRLQRPDLARQLATALVDSFAAIRAEGGNAIAQSVSHVARRASDSGQVDVRWVAERLERALDIESDPAVRDAFSEALGRLPFGDSSTAQAAERTILAYGGGGFGAVHGLYWIALNSRTTGGLTLAAVTMLRGAAHAPADAVARRVAVLTLGSVNALDSTTTFGASDDPDEQVRRLALAGIRNLSPIARGAVLRKALADSSQIVRIAAVPLARGSGSLPDCSAIVAATRDSSAYVALTAIDQLAKPCADSVDVTATLVPLLYRGSGEQVTTTTKERQLQVHALVALAQIDHARGRAAIGAYASAPTIAYNIYAAKAAAIVGDTTALRHLAGRSNNVQEAVIDAWSAIAKHNADPVYIASLTSPGYQVVLAAATALAGTTDSAALPALLDAFDRLSRQPRENTKDPRVAVLKRISELGSNANTARLRPYLADIDTIIAGTVATTLTKWTGTPVTAHAQPLPIQAEPLARVLLAKNVQLLVTMASGATFTIRLFNDEAPATAARMLRLARAHYFDGHLFQRVEPNFVVQGGGPDASEYVGDAEFMRDEITWRSHLRGTLGISSRGRDTGDAQWFFNLTDNTRLDHEYTVFAEVTSGRDVVERILEGDLIRTVVVGP